MSDFTEKKISRRTVAKGAAWSVPVVAVAAAAPAHAASADGNVTVSGSCVGFTVPILNVTAGHPKFTISATGVALPAGSTLTLSTGTIAAADVQLAGSSDNGVSLSVLGNGDTRVTLDNGLSDGGSTSLEVGGAGSNGGLELDANVATTFTLTLDPGQVDQASTTDDSASVSLLGASLGVGPLSVDLAVCN